MKTFVLAGQQVSTSSIERFNPRAKARKFALEVDGILVPFDEKSKEAKMVQEARMGPRELENYFNGGNFSFVNTSSGPEFLDYGLKGSFVLDDASIEAFEELVGVQTRAASVTSMVQKMPGMNQNVFLGGRENTINDIHYAVKGEGGKVDMKSMFTWSHHSELLQLHAAEVRLLCENGMAATKAVQGNTVQIVGNYEHELEIAQQGFMSGVTNAMDNRYNALMDKSLSVRQAKQMAETLKSVALTARANMQTLSPLVLEKVAKLEVVVYNIFNSLLSVYSQAGLRDPAFGGAPTKIAAIEAVDVLTETLTHIMSKLPDSGGFSNLSSVQKLIQDLMFSDKQLFVMGDINGSSDWDASQSYYLD